MDGMHGWMHGVYMETSVSCWILHLDRGYLGVYGEVFDELVRVCMYVCVDYVGWDLLYTPVVVVVYFYLFLLVFLVFGLRM